MDDPLTFRWRRSTKCVSSGCLEVATTDGEVVIRNSTQPQVAISFSTGAFRDFVAQVKRA